jgi:hypothetical protein
VVAVVLTDLRDLVAELEHRGEAMATIAAYIDAHPNQQLRDS